MQRVEEKALELGADKLTVRAAINVRAFYEKLGYTYRVGLKPQTKRGIM